MSDNNYNFSNYQEPQPVDPNAPQNPPPQLNPVGGNIQPQNYNEPVPLQPQQPIPQNYNIPTMPADGNQANQQYTSTPTSLIEDSDEDSGNRFNIKRFLPFIIVGVIGLIVLIIVVSLLFSNREAETPTPQNIVLQWWGVFVDKETVQPILEEYNSQNPNVTIEYADKWASDQPYDQAQTTYKEELDRVLSANDAVQIPDIFMVHNSWVGDYERFVKPSTSYTFEDFSSAFYPVVSEDFAQGGSVYGAPLWIDTFTILYNKDLLEENAVLNIPKDWASFKSLAQNLTTKENNQVKTAGFAAGVSSNTSFGFDLANILLAQNGVSMLDSTGQPAFSTDPDSVAALQFYKDFLNTANPTWSENFENDSASFLDGEVAMIIAPSYRLRDILFYNEQYGKGLDIGISQIPQLQGQDQEIINWPDYWGAMTALNRPNSTEAWKFINWMTQPEQLRKLSDNIKEKDGYFGILYPRSDMSEDLVADEYLQIYNESLPFLKTWYMVKGVDIETTFDEVLNGNSISQSQISSLQEDIQILMSNKGKL